MKIFLYVCLIASFNIIYSGDHNTSIKLKLSDNSFKKPDINLPSSSYKTADMPVSWYIPVIINPMLVIEDKKVFFGLTKEISVGKFPYGRLAFEYSYIFRSYNQNHLRLSYNYDIILAAGDFVGFIATPGAGYFTDTKNQGWFVHGSVGAILGPGEPLVFMPYLRYRHTFITEKTKSDINDISLGVGISFYY